MAKKFEILLGKRYKRSNSRRENGNYNKTNKFTFRIWI